MWLPLGVAAAALLIAVCMCRRLSAKLPAPPVPARPRGGEESVEARADSELGVSDLELGVSELKSEELGVSVAYLLSAFPQEARAATGQQDPDFHAICEALAVGPAGKGGGRVCPRDGRPGCSIVDALAGPHRGRCTHFVSWCWNYTLSEVVSAIGQWVQDSGSDPAATFLWMCFFCNNQFRIVQDRTQAGSDSLQGIFEEHLALSGRMLLLLNSYAEPTYITRAWCIFECYVAVTTGIPITVILPATAEASFQQVVGSRLHEVRDTFRQLDAQRAVASYQADEDTIKDIIRNSDGGFEAINGVVKGQLLQWLASRFQGYMSGGP